ncbi:spondin_N family protein, partial [Vibrio parahaemolyticus VPTS-2010]|jgi:hypothetical protein
MGIF